MNTRKIEDKNLRQITEWGVLSALIISEEKRASCLLIELSEILTPPLMGWFSGDKTIAIAVALDACLRQEARPGSGIAEYLAGLPHDILFEIKTGKKPAEWKKCEYEGSALQAIGGFNALSVPEEFESKIQGTAPDYARTLRALVERERAIEALRDTAKAIAQCNLSRGPAAEISAGIEKLSALIGGKNLGRNLGECLLSAVKEAQLGAELREAGNDKPVTWGIRELDLLCPLRQGSLYVLSAPPGGGKTSLALGAAAATAKTCGKGSVSIVSLEMSGEDLATILVGQELDIAPASIREWSPAAQRRVDEINTLAAEWKNNDSLMVRDLSDNNQKQTVSAISAWLRQRHNLTRGRQALAVVDYLGLIDREARQTEYDAISQATRTLKRLALSLRIPIILLAQMNREGVKPERDTAGRLKNNPRPRIQDLKGSGSIEADADAIVFIYFENTGEKSPNEPCEIILAKQRRGPSGSIEASFYGRHQRFAVRKAEEIPGLDNPPATAARMATPPNESEDLFAEMGQP